MKKNRWKNLTAKMVIAIIATLFLSSAAGVAAIAEQETETEKTETLNERKPPETDAIVNGAEAKVHIGYPFMLMNASSANGWVSLCDGMGKGFGCPWIALSLDKAIEIYGVEGAEVYVGTSGILHFKLTDTESGKEVSPEELLYSSEGDTIDFTLLAERYDWDGNLTDSTVLGNITERDTQAYFNAFDSAIASQVSAVGASYYGDSVDVAVQNADGDAVVYGQSGEELVRYPETDASNLQAAMSSDRKILVISSLYSDYWTDIFTVGPKSDNSDDMQEQSGTTYTDADTIRKVQEALNRAGYDCGTPDGISGSHTVGAINSYRAANGMEQNGAIDEQLLTALGLN